jgi:hypothetical protein
MLAIPGFQSHNTLGRYFLMLQDLTFLSTTTTHPAFADFQATLTVCSPDLCSHQESKANKFVSAAMEAIDTHFVHWCNKSLLPAALFSEMPLAKVVAHVVLNSDYALDEFEFQSIEAGVKEAKKVSPMERSEPLQSTHAIA